MSKDRFVVALCFMVFLLATFACGKKGPPTLPKKEFSARVGNLRGEWSEGIIFLRGNIDGLKPSDDPRDLIKGSRVYYSQYPLERPPCAGCPIAYRGYHMLGKEVIAAEGFFARVPAGIQKRVYFLKVNLIGPGGALGPPSDTFRLVVDSDLSKNPDQRR